jgi:diguanylate cyclase (GGDEF)-like protein/PAS domain S-box-containing protein
MTEGEIGDAGSFRQLDGWSRGAAATSARTLASGFEQSEVGLAITAVDGEGVESLVRVNGALIEMLGYEQTELADRIGDLLGLDLLNDEPGSKRPVRKGRDYVSTEIPLVRRDGREIWVAITVEAIRDSTGGIAHRTIRIEDIGGRRQEERALRYLADHDSLTGLLNRRRFTDEVARAIANADRFGDDGTLLFLDLDHFKHLNDAYGHSVGDAYLTRFANLLREATRATDILARLSGDEFAILLPRTTPQEAATLAEKIRVATHVLNAGAVADEPVTLTVSIGMTQIRPDADATAADLLVEADLAMYDAKQAGRDKVRTFAPERQQRHHMAARLAWATQIRTALENDTFVLHAQPIVRASDRAPVWYELLLRMPGADGRLLLPSAFLYAAGRFGLEARIDFFVIEQSIEYLRRIEDQTIGLAINVSRGLLVDPRHAHVIRRLLADAEVEPDRLLFEIVETVFVDISANVAQFVEILRDAGCRFALDDFGAGYTSFHHLKGLAVEYVKIDGEFVAPAVDSERDRLFVGKMTELAHGLGMDVIGEAVGDEPTAALMAEIGVDYLQGFGIRKPGPVADVIALLPPGGA